MEEIKKDMGELENNIDKVDEPTMTKTLENCADYIVAQADALETRIELVSAILDKIV